MSSPKGAAAKAAGRSRASGKPSLKLAKPAAVKISSAKPAAGDGANGASADANKLAAEMMQGLADGRLDVVSAPALQSLMAATCRLYAARVEGGEQFVPLARNSVSATDVMVTASGMLKAVDLAVFELGMWQSWTGR